MFEKFVWYAGRKSRLHEMMTRKFMIVLGAEGRRNLLVCASPRLGRTTFRNTVTENINWLCIKIINTSTSK